MKVVSLCLAAAALGCATSEPFVLSEQQRNRVVEMIRDAEAAGAAEGSPVAAECLADAKSELDYSQRLPLYPDRARVLFAKAQADAEKALELARSEARARQAAREAARHEVLAGAAAP